MDIRGIYLYLTDKEPKFWGDDPTEKVYSNKTCKILFNFNGNGISNGLS